MKRIFMFVLVTLFCVCVPSIAHAGETISYTNYGGCTLITKRASHWLAGKWTSYGLAKDGIEILPPCCEVWYDDALRILTFRQYIDHVSHKYRFFMYSADSGKLLYKGEFRAASSGNYEPYITFENKGKYRNAVVNYYIDHRQGCGKKTIGNFFRQNGKLYQVQEKQMKVEAPVD